MLILSQTKMAFKTTFKSLSSVHTLRDHLIASCLYFGPEYARKAFTTPQQFQAANSGIIFGSQAVSVFKRFFGIDDDLKLGDVGYPQLSGEWIERARDLLHRDFDSGVVEGRFFEVRDNAIVNTALNPFSGSLASVACLPYAMIPNAFQFHIVLARLNERTMMFEEVSQDLNFEDAIVKGYSLLIKRAWFNPDILMEDLTWEKNPYIDVESIGSAVASIKNLIIHNPGFQGSLSETEFSKKIPNDLTEDYTFSKRLLASIIPGKDFKALWKTTDYPLLLSKFLDLNSTNQYITSIAEGYYCQVDQEPIFSKMTPSVFKSLNLTMEDLRLLFGNSAIPNDVFPRLSQLNLAPKVYLSKDVQEVLRKISLKYPLRFVTGLKDILEQVCYELFIKNHTARYLNLVGYKESLSVIEYIVSDRIKSSDFGWVEINSKKEIPVLLGGWSSLLKGQARVDSLLIELMTDSEMKGKDAINMAPLFAMSKRTFNDTLISYALLARISPENPLNGLSRDPLMRFDLGPTQSGSFEILYPLYGSYMEGTNPFSKLSKPFKVPKLSAPDCVIINWVAKFIEMTQNQQLEQDLAKALIRVGFLNHSQQPQGDFESLLSDFRELNDSTAAKRVLMFLLYPNSARFTSRYTSRAIFYKFCKLCYDKNMHHLFYRIYDNYSLGQIRRGSDDFSKYIENDSGVLYTGDGALFDYSLEAPNLSVVNYCNKFTDKYIIF
jgi:hypothetical protein